MHHIMFDVDGTLVQSNDFDTDCFVRAIEEVLNISIDSDWSKYRHVSGVGILDEIIHEDELKESKIAIKLKVKETFIRLISEYLESEPAKEVPGASLFLSQLSSIDDVTLSIATGGWHETAILKLQSAGIDVSDIPIASSNDHFSRTEIMRIAKSKAGKQHSGKCTYFGDGVWDKKACNELGYNFVLVGKNADHNQNINDFQQIDEAMTFIGLSQVYQG